jgi:hypothetical protein
MMELYAQDFIHTGSIGDLAGCKQAFDEVIDKIKELYHTDQIGGYQLVVVVSAEDAEEKFIWCDYANVTAGIFPFLCAVIQPHDQHPIDVSDAMSEWSFSPCSAV